MKSNSLLFKSAVICLALSATTVLQSCNDDDEEDQTPTPNPSAITIDGPNAVTLAPGETTDVVLNFDGGGAAAAIIVNRNGGFLEEVPLSAAATTYTYTTPEVPANATEGEQIVYSFALENTAGTASGETPFTITVAVFPTIDLGGTEVYNVSPIPEGGILPSGADIVLAAGNSYYISQSLYFGAGTSLTIGAGTTIYLGEDVEVEIQEGAGLSVEGTSTAPVVMTAETVLTGNPVPGYWNRFRLNGNQNGTVRYLRTEYAHNGIRISGTDNSNTVEYVQSWSSAAEGFYITGGDINSKYLLATNSGEGSYRLGDDYAGDLQFVIGYNSEWYTDNDDFTVRETASPRIANLTLVGPGADQENTHAIRLRAASAGKIYNAAVTDFPRRGVRAADDVQISDLNGGTVFAYGFVWNVPTDPYRELGVAFAGTFDEVTGAQLTNPFFNNATGIDAEGDFILSEIAGIGNGSFIPSQAQSSAFNPSSLGGAFVSAPFVGAIESPSGDWTTGWSKNPDGTIR